MSNAVFAEQTSGKPDNRTLNSNDGIDANGGNQLVLATAGSTAAGYTALFQIGLNL